MDQGLESSIAQSLLSLSKTSSAIPIVAPSANSQQETADSLLFTDGSGGGGSFGGTPGFPAGFPGSVGAGSVGNSSTLKHHRRLSSTGKTKRRLSDARDAASRPSPASLSLSGLSLNSPPHTHVPLSTSFTSAMGASSPVNISGQAHDGFPGSLGSVSSSIPGLHGNGLPASVDIHKPMIPGAVVGSAPAGTIVKPVPIAKNGKKRGMDHRCEMCNKVYRHPSCLIKHRWEHTSHWRESSKYVLSKHQQVQLLEAAAILSHFSSDSATGTSLPEDRSLWPSFLSGGALPLPEGSCSVPAATSSTRATSTGPRLHDYAISSADAVKVRPGLVVANGNAAGGEQTTNVTVKGSTPIPVPNGTEVYGYGYGYGRAGSAPRSSASRGKSWGDQSSSPYNTRSSGAAANVPLSLPRSSLRSGSSSSASGSGSGGRSGSSELEDEEEVEDQEEDGDVDVDVVDVDGGFAGKMRYPYEYDTGVKTGMKSMKEEEEDWEMEMDMD